MKELYEQYINKTDNVEENIEKISNICREYPKMIEYIFNKIDSCFGPHKVYVVHMKLTTENVHMIKIGYTKNDTKTRFSEKRYSGMGDVELVEILREETLQAKGAVDLEKELQERFKDCYLSTNITFPGKGEMYGYNHRESILEAYDELIETHRNTVGFKSPN